MGKKKPAKKDKKGKKEQKKSTKAKKKDGKTKGAARKKTVPAEARRQLSHEERLEMIRTAAYYLAERRDFKTGREAEDWLEAEREIHRQYPL